MKLKDIVNGVYFVYLRGSNYFDHQQQLLVFVLGFTDVGMELLVERKTFVLFMLSIISMVKDEDEDDSQIVAIVLSSMMTNNASLFSKLKILNIL